MADDTPANHLEKFKWKKGQSGNPAGRPKGSRTKLAEHFLADMQADWQEHGTEVIARVREERPDQYLKVVASILPKELNVNTNPVEELTDDQLGDLLDAARASLERSRAETERRDPKTTIN